MYPILLEFGPITIFSLWFFVALGFVAGSLMLVRLAKQNRIKLNLISEHSFFLFIWALIISRVVFIALHTDLYFYNFQFGNIWKILSIWDKGLSFWGATFAFIAGIFYLSKKYNQSSLRLLDIIAPSILIGMLFGNIGAFLDGINYGSPTELPWGISFRSANVKYISPIHPTQLYSALYTLILAIGLIMLLNKTRSLLAGFIAEVGLLTFSIFKFFEDFMRGDEIFKIFSIRISQILAFAGILIAAYLIYQRYLNKNSSDPQHLLANFVKSKLTNFFSKEKKQDSEETVAKIHSLQNQMR